MSRIQAIYENGAFRPLEPVSLKENERVTLTIETCDSGFGDVLDEEFLAHLAPEGDDSVSLEEVRQALAKYTGSLADDICADRDER